MPHHFIMIVKLPFPSLLKVGALVLCTSPWILTSNNILFSALFRALTFEMPCKEISPNFNTGVWHHPGEKKIDVFYTKRRQQKLESTWFFPFSMRMLVTLPKGKPKAITSVSVTSPGNFLICRTREGAPSILSSPLNFLLSLPLAERNF